MKQFEKPLLVFKETLKKEVNQTIDAIDIEKYEKALTLIQEAVSNGNRIHVTAIGKPSYVAGYIASLISSTGHPCYVLDATEAVHGSSGQVACKDVVIAISNSGQTQELIATVSTLIKNDAVVIGCCGDENSWLAKNVNAFLYAGVQQEGGPLNRAPRASIIAEAIVLQGLSVCLQSMANITPSQYVKWHPGGALGKLRESEK